jgi:7-cyano-7-deazaguanine synthase in queuosine biosynthesis
MKNDQNNIVSLSGGKDSTAMIEMMIERGEKIHSVIYCDMAHGSSRQCTTISKPLRNQ